MEKTNPEWKVRHSNLSDMKRVLNRIIYQKGAWTLHMLRSRIGDAAFQKGIREYYVRYQNLNATTADFERVMEEASGQKLGWFFDQWLNRSGSPMLKGSWSWDAAAKKVMLEMEGSPGYRLPLEISIDGHVYGIELVQGQQRFSFNSDKEPQEVKLDPGTKALIQASFLRSAKLP